MAKNWPKYLESIANVALIVCCVVVVAFLTRNYIGSRNRETDPSPEHPPSSKPTIGTLVGKKLTTPDIDWTKNQETLLLVLKKGCRFCDESAPFYQRLTKELSSEAKIHFIAVR